MMKSSTMLLLLCCLILNICFVTTAAAQDDAITAPFGFNPAGTVYTNFSPGLSLTVDAPLSCEPTCKVTVKIGPDVRWDPALPLLFLATSAGTVWDATFKTRIQVSVENSTQPQAGAFNTRTGEISWDVKWPALPYDPETQNDPKVESRKLRFKLAGTSFPNTVTIQSLVLKDPQGASYELSAPWGHPRAAPISEKFEVVYDYLAKPTVFQKDYRTLALKLTDLKMPLSGAIILTNNSTGIFQQFESGVTTPCDVYMGKDGTKVTTAKVTINTADTVMTLTPNTPLATGTDITISCTAWGIHTHGDLLGKKRWAYILQNDNNMISTEAPLPPFPKKDGDDDGSGAGIGGFIAFVLVILAIGGGAFYYFKVYKPKQQAAAQDDSLLRSDADYHMA